MSETPVPRDPGRDENPPGVPAGPGDGPRLGSPDWRLVPQSPDWPPWMDDDAHADDELAGMICAWERAEAAMAARKHAAVAEFIR